MIDLVPLTLSALAVIIAVPESLGGITSETVARFPLV